MVKLNESFNVRSKAARRRRAARGEFDYRRYEGMRLSFIDVSHQAE